MNDVVVSTYFCDLDGTLIDTAQANFRAYHLALEQFGVPFDWKCFTTTWGRDSRDFLPEVAPTLSSGQIAQVRSEKANCYPQFLQLTRLNVPLYRLLVSLKGTASIGLVTTAKRANVSDVLLHHHLDGLFDYVVCGEDTTRSKPWPDPYLYALQVARIPAERAITFEDSATGMESARRAGIAAVRIGFSHEG